MNNTITCPHCSRAVPVPEDRSHWAGHCECGRSVFDAIQPEDQDSIGDIHATDDGLSIETPNGPWTVTEDQALKLITGLSVMVRHQMTEGRELRRPVDQTTDDDGLTIQFRTSNDAFEDHPGTEVARILHALADRVEHGIPDVLPILDVNGNRVGHLNHHA